MGGGGGYILSIDIVKAYAIIRLWRGIIGNNGVEWSENIYFHLYIYIFIVYSIYYPCIERKCKVIINKMCNSV